MSTYSNVVSTTGPQYFPAIAQFLHSQLGLNDVIDTRDIMQPYEYQATEPWLGRRLSAIPDRFALNQLLESRLVMGPTYSDILSTATVFQSPFLGYGSGLIQRTGLVENALFSPLYTLHCVGDGSIYSSAMDAFLFAGYRNGYSTSAANNLPTVKNPSAIGATAAWDAVDDQFKGATYPHHGMKANGTMWFPHYVYGSGKYHAIFYRADTYTGSGSGLVYDPATANISLSGINSVSGAVSSSSSVVTYGTEYYSTGSVDVHWWEIDITPTLTGGNAWKSGSTVIPNPGGFVPFLQLTVDYDQYAGGSIVGSGTATVAMSTVNMVQDYWDATAIIQSCEQNVYNPHDGNTYPAYYAADISLGA